jgi:hypothetical protein
MKPVFGNINEWKAA